MDPETLSPRHTLETALCRAPILLLHCCRVVVTPVSGGDVHSRSQVTIVQLITMQSTVVRRLMLDVTLQFL
jgi:hypothetical protein